MIAVFRFYTHNLYPLGKIECDTSSDQFKKLMEAGYGYTRGNATGSESNTYNRLDTPGDFERLRALE